MKPTEVANIIVQLTNEIQSFAPDWHRIAGNNMMQSVQLRVVGSGTDYQGSALKNFRGETYSSPYAKYRRSKGRTTSQRTYNFSGDMWRGIGVEKADMSGFTLAGLNEYSKKILGYAQKNDGYNLVQPNEKEIEAAGLFIKQKLIETLNRYL